MGDRRLGLSERYCGEGIEREPADDGCRFVASEPVEEGGEDSRGGTRLEEPDGVTEYRPSGISYPQSKRPGTWQSGMIQSLI